MADYLPLFMPGRAVVGYSTSAAVVGGQLLGVSGSGTVAKTSAATAGWVGVAAYDAASGAKVTIWRGGVQKLVNTGGVTAGQTVEAAANGTVATHTGGTHDDYIVGVCMTTAADGAVVEVAMAR